MTGPKKPRGTPMVTWQFEWGPDADPVRWTEITATLISQKVALRAAEAGLVSKENQPDLLKLVYEAVASEIGAWEEGVNLTLRRLKASERQAKGVSAYNVKRKTHRPLAARILARVKIEANHQDIASVVGCSARYVRKVLEPIREQIHQQENKPHRDIAASVGVCLAYVEQTLSGRPRPRPERA